MRSYKKIGPDWFSNKMTGQIVFFVTIYYLFNLRMFSNKNLFKSILWAAQEESENIKIFVIILKENLLNNFDYSPREFQCENNFLEKSFFL